MLCFSEEKERRNSTLMSTASTGDRLKEAYEYGIYRALFENDVRKR